MHALGRLVPQSITAQIAALVAVAILLGHILAGGVIPLLFPDAGPDLLVTRIATITQLAKSTRSPAEMEALLEAAQRAGVAVRAVQTSALVSHVHGDSVPLFVKLLTYRLEFRWGISPTSGVTLPGAKSAVIVVPVGRGTALVFQPPVDGAFSRVSGRATAALMMVSIFIVLASIYAVRWITSPLRLIAAASRAFGRSPTDGGLLPEGGPREIDQVAKALNDMRSRIRTLVDDRTRMLAAISHDLRTPLTRLRLRAEHLVDRDIQAGMLRDIETVTDMLGETLSYLREGSHFEAAQRLDLPSLLQSICTEFTDVGHDVSYEGPARQALSCKPRALTRAVTNIVDNATKHASHVTVKLDVSDRSCGVKIEVHDDGPGIAPEFRHRVFEPFFKADPARTSGVRAGFGLGLSIARDIVSDHGGKIELLGSEPRGLIVRISLIAARAEPTSASPLVIAPAGDAGNDA